MIVPQTERCFINGVEYDRTIIRLRAEADLRRNRAGQMVPYNLRCSAEIDTANPELIAKLFDATFTNERINVLIDGKVRTEASNGMVVARSQYCNDGPTANFDLNFGEPIRVAVPKPGKKK